MGHPARECPIGYRLSMYCRTIRLFGQLRYTQL